MIKKDIKSLPFDRIYSTILELAVAEEEDMLTSAKALVKNNNERRIKTAAKVLERYGEYEEGSDGYEEDAREGLNLTNPDDVELTSSEKRECFDIARKSVVSQFIKDYNIGLGHSWILPQMISYFGDNWTVVRNDKGLIDGYLTAKKSNNNDFARGLYFVAMWERKDLGTWPKGATTWYKLPEYNHLVPLIMKGIKQCQNINYSEWDRDTVSWVMDKELYEAATTIPPIMSVEDRLELRQHGLCIGTGVHKGEYRSPVSTFSLAHMDSYNKYDLSNLNRLSIAMLAQIGVAHPSNTNPRYQILDPNNWDTAPEPLVKEVVDDVLWTPGTKVKSTYKKSSIRGNVELNTPW